MTGIKNIIFDLGGVLLDIDYQKTISAFKELGIPDFEEMFTQFHANDLFAGLETGRISEEEFYSVLKKTLPVNISKQQVTDAWNAMMLSFRTESLITLEKLTKKYSLFILSNTNSIHLDCFRRIFTRDTGKPLMETYFSKCWYSHVIGLRKPGRSVFEFVLEDAKLEAAETLFIDDTISNIEAAKELGIKTHHMQPHERIAGILDHMTGETQLSMDHLTSSNSI